MKNEYWKISATHREMIIYDQEISENSESSHLVVNKKLMEN